MLKTHSTAIHKRLAAWLIVCLIVAVYLVAVIHPTQVYGETFGSGPYGVCSYQTTCAPSTTVTLPAPTTSPTTPAAPPLEVNINLANGQVISKPGYTVVVTPLNGQGASFQQVQFYINGQLVQTQAPGEDGTARWFWNITQWPGTTIEVVVTGQDGQTVAKTFSVIIRSAAAAPPSTLQQIVSAPQHIVRGLTRTISKLPPTVKYGLPYFLFLVLIGDTLLLLYRTRQELVEEKRLQALLIRERRTRELKHTFIELVSHYLRTPLTIIGGGVELAGQQESVSSLIAQVRDSIKHMNQCIDVLIAQLSEKDQSTAPAEASQLKSQPLWRQPNLYVLLGSIGFSTFSFDYLARHSHGFSIGEVNIIVQLVLFISLCFLVYHTLRQSKLKSRDRAKLSEVLAAETTFGNDRDELIAVSGMQVKQSLDQLSAQASQIEQPKAREFIDKGLQQLDDIVGKLLVANQLKGSKSIEPYVSADFEALVHESVAGLEAKISAKAVQLKTGQNATFQVQNADLFAVVLRTILDNAIAYSEQGGSIEVSVAPTDTKVTVAVVDHGQGIATDKQYSLFQAFSKTEGAETFNHEGMGFSLYLDKLIMNYLVGDITVESEPKQGTKVSLTLPQPIESQGIYVSSSSSD